MGDGFQGVFHAHRPRGGLPQKQKSPSGVTAEAWIFSPALQGFFQSSLMFAVLMA